MKFGKDAMLRSQSRGNSRSTAIVVAAVTAVGFAGFGQLARANTILYWDTSTSSGLQPGASTWDTGTTAPWSSASTGSNPLLPWVNDGTYQAYFNTGGGGNTIAVAG